MFANSRYRSTHCSICARDGSFPCLTLDCRSLLRPPVLQARVSPAWEFVLRGCDESNVAWLLNVLTPSIQSASISSWKQPRVAEARIIAQASFMFATGPAILKSSTQMLSTAERNFAMTCLPQNAPDNGCPQSARRSYTMRFAPRRPLSSWWEDPCPRPLQLALCPDLLSVRPASPFNDQWQGAFLHLCLQLALSSFSGLRMPSPTFL